MMTKMHQMILNTSIIENENNEINETNELQKLFYLVIIYL